MAVIPSTRQGDSDISCSGWRNRKSLSIPLPLAHNKFACEIFRANLSGFFPNPAIKSDFPDAAEIVQLYVVRVPSRLVSDWCQQNTRKICAVKAQLHTFGFDTIQRCTSLRQMKVVSILLTAAFANYFFLRYTQFGMNQFGQLICQIVFVQFAKEACQTTGGCQCLVIYLSFSL